jgi:hypothetical protein
MRRRRRQRYDLSSVWHAIYPKIAESEIQHRNLWLRPLEIQRRYEKEEDELN